MKKLSHEVHTRQDGTTADVGMKITLELHKEQNGNPADVRVKRDT